MIRRFTLARDGNYGREKLRDLAGGLVLFRFAPRRREWRAIVTVEEERKASRHASKREVNCVPVMEAMQPSAARGGEQEGLCLHGGERRGSAALLRRREESHRTATILCEPS